MVHPTSFLSASSHLHRALMVQSTLLLPRFVPFLPTYPRGAIDIAPSLLLLTLRRLFTQPMPPSNTICPHSFSMNTRRDNNPYSNYAPLEYNLHSCLQPACQSRQQSVLCSPRVQAGRITPQLDASQNNSGFPSVIPVIATFPHGSQESID